jgi:hypothetical protein
MQKEAKKFPGAGRFDPLNSTYKHEIYLTNGKLLTGYSKGLFHSEPADKTILLERVIVRLIRNGYLAPIRTNRIDFFLNNYLGGNDVLVVSLYPYHYSLGEHKEVIADPRTFQFLKKLYDAINKGELITKDLQHKPVLSNEEIIFDIRKKRFQNDQELHEYIQKQLKNGCEEGTVMNFYYKYRLKWFSEPSGNPS